MTHRNNDVQSSAIVSDERLRNTLREQLHFAINVSEDRKTRAQIAEQSGINIYQIDAILSRDPAKKRPIHANEMLSLAFVLGHRAVNAMVGMIGYAGAHLDEAEASGPALAAVEMMENVARFARCAADNRIDHTEERVTTEAADNVINLALPYSSRRAG